MATDHGESLLTFDQLLRRSHDFHAKTPFPTTANRLQVLGSTAERQQKIVQQAQQVRVLVHHETLQVIRSFLQRKQTRGNAIEQQVYRGMSEQDFVQRCIEKRPLVFMGKHDFTITRERTKMRSAVDQWQKVGSLQETKPLVLREYLSYEEMAISALLGVSTPSYFINTGTRQNHAEPMNDGEFQPEGVVVGLVGARFKIANQMESRFVLRSVPSTPSAPPAQLQEEWQEMYGENRLIQLYAPKHTQQQRFIEVPGQPDKRFDAFAYRRRMRISFELLLYEAESRAHEASRQAYVHVVGLGLGVWQLLKQVQTELYVDEFLDVLRSGPFEHVGVVDFSWITPPKSLQKTEKLQVTTATGNEVAVVFSKHPPAQKLSDEFLLVSSYAWDSNSFPGNEYWSGSLSSSGDPAMASCSTIAELQNPYVNPFARNMRVVEMVESKESAHACSITLPIRNIAVGW